MKRLWVFVKGLFSRDRVISLENIKKFIYVALGDSTVEGMGASSPEKAFAARIFSEIQHQVENVEFHNFGISGARVSDVIDLQLEKTLDAKPHLVIISIGANDVLRRTKLKDFENQFTLLIDKLHATKALLVVNTIPDFSASPLIPRIAAPIYILQIKRFNAVIKKHAKKVNAIVVDVENQKAFYKGDNTLLSIDGFHPSDAGYEIWAQNILTALGPHLKK